MSNYYQLSTDYDQAWNLIQAGEKVIGWMYDEVSKQTELITASKSNDSGVAFERQWLSSPKMATASKFIELAQFRSAQFLLPIPDPTIEISNLKDQIDGRDAALRGSAKIIQELNQEIERLQEASKSVQPIAHSRAESIDQLREVIDQNNKAFAQENERLLAVIEERYKKIDILQDNLDRADNDRLSELTSIMRMLQAWESVPIQKWSGALHLIKRVLFDAICKLDPSQAVES